MKIYKHVPNALTCANLVCGCYSCILALNGNYLGAMIFIFIAAGFDFLDGLAARVLKAYSPIGKELDSLADVVSFGVAPGMVLFDFLDRTQKTISWENPLVGKIFLLAAFAIPVFSALRLAKFNIDDRQTTSFIGLPVPAHAIFWVPLIYTITIPESADAWLGFFPGFQLYLQQIPSIYLLFSTSFMALGSSLLLVSEIPMFSLKVKSLAWQGNEIRYILFLTALIFVLCFGVLGISMTILSYVLLSLFNGNK